MLPIKALKARGVIAIRLSLGSDISVSWPSWDGVDVWDVWDARRMTQGALKAATRTTLDGALAVANALIPLDLETPEGRETRNKIMRGED